MPPSPFSVEALLGDRAWVRALALSLAGDAHRADDLEQQTWLRALERPPVRGDAPEGWIATVMRNLARDGGRSDRRRTAREGGAARDALAPPTIDLVARAEAHQRVIRAVLALREPLRTTVLLRFFEDLPPRAIAERTGVPAATVRTRLHRALRELRGDLEREDPRGWRPALAPLAIHATASSSGSASAPSAAAQALKGGILVTTQKKIGIAAVLLLLLVGVSAPFVLGGGEPDAPAPEEAEQATADGPVERSRRRARNPAPVASPVADEDSRAAADDGVTIEIDAPEPPPRQRLDVHLLRELPSAGDAARPEEEGEETLDVDVGGAGAGGLTVSAADTKWAPVPLKGDVTLRGTVRDSTGRAVEGATILRVLLDAAGRPVRWGRWIKFDRIGRTDAGGRFDIDGQPAGTFLIGADFHTVMRRSGDLSTEGAQRVVSRAGATSDGIHIRLPFDTRHFGVVEGTITGADGEPMRGNMVSFGRHGMYADRDGRFRVGGVEPGKYTVRVHPPGHRPAALEVTVAANETVRADLRVEYLEEGDLELVGRVVDRAGRAVAGSTVYFGTGQDDGRHTRTGSDGTFRFPGLHARFAKDPVNLVVHPPGSGRAHTSEWRYGVTVPTPDLVLVVDRLSPLFVKLRDAVTGAPLQLFAMTLESVQVVGGEEQRKQLRGLSTYREDGEIELSVPAGRVELRVEAKDHRGVVIAVDVPDTDGPLEIVLELRPR